jgi:hypothetical protein
MSNRTELAAFQCPKIASVQPEDGTHITVTWSSGGRVGKTETIDLFPMIGTFKLYRPLCESRKLFEDIHIEEGGAIIVWGQDDEIDMTSDSIERLAEETWTADDFNTFLSDQKLTHAAAAAQLGKSRRQIENYLSGHQEIPRTVVLACFGLEARRRPKLKTWPIANAVSRSTTFQTQMVNNESCAASVLRYLPS